jgi:alkylation response protein AidB-like acyl-CoA dehydrogenase
MDFTWSNEQRELFTAIERFAAAELNEGIAERDERGEFSRDGWRKCGEFGIPGLPIEEKYGGSGLDALTTVGALERLGYACRDNGLVFSINAHMWTVLMPIAAFGTEEQKQRYLPGLANGSLIGGNGTSEPDSGSDAYSMRSTAVKRGDRYVLNGSKIFVTNGPVADVLVVYANTNPEKGPL